jgi:hypothetical protein
LRVRAGFTAGEVRRLAKRAKDAAQARRLLAIAAVLDGASREDAAKIGGMERQTLRDWVIRFNQQGPGRSHQRSFTGNCRRVRLSSTARKISGKFMRQNWLSNRIFKSFDDIVDHCCSVWNALIDQPWKITGPSSVNQSEGWYNVYESATADAAGTVGSSRLRQALSRFQLGCSAGSSLSTME